MIRKEDDAPNNNLNPKTDLNFNNYQILQPGFSDNTGCSSRHHGLLQKVNRVLESHLENNDLNVTTLIRMLGISRTSLHRKLTAATGMNTTEYIRFYRLYKATVLLTNNPEMNIFQITVAVGFGNQSYFSKKFKELLGCSPTNFRNKIFQKSGTETLVLKKEHLLQMLEHVR